MPDVRTQQARERADVAKVFKETFVNHVRVSLLAEDVFYLADRVAALETALRWELWINHGCPPVALYGDDGEMSCGMCVWDFKRSDVLDTIEYVKGARLKRAAALAAAQEPPGEEGGRPVAVTVGANSPGSTAPFLSAQEPPAECPDCGLELEPGEKHKQVEGVGCVAQEPPGEGGDR